MVTTKNNYEIYVKLKDLTIPQLEEEYFDAWQEGNIYSNYVAEDEPCLPDEEKMSIIEKLIKRKQKRGEQ